MTDVPFEPGAVLGGRYVLRKHEWTSGLGEVWLARDRVLDRAVFVQSLGPTLARDEATRRMFLRSASEVAQLSDATLLRVYDIGDDPPFVIFEHAAGGRLVDRLRAGALRPSEAARAALSVARGLEALHARGATHGALSPATVLFDGEGRAKILALGVPGPDPSDPAERQPPGYRPPEPDPLPADADRYALAALLHHMATGKPPEPGARARRVPQLDALLARALSADPAQRPSLDAFEGALAPLARVEPAAARGPRFSASEFRWLIPAVLIVVVAVLAVTLGVSLVQDFADRGTPSPTGTATRSPEGEPLAVASVADFDPEGDGEENAEDAGRVIDGDGRTAWGTVGYSNEELGNSKSGVGLLFDLGEVTDLARVRVQSTLDGWTAQIRVAAAEGDEAGDYERVARFTAATEVTVPLPAGTRGRYVLLWITRLVDEGGGSEFPYGAEVSEVEFFAA